MRRLSYSGRLYNDRRRFYLEGRNEPVMLYASETPFISSLFAKGGEQTEDKDFKIFEHRAAWRYQSVEANEGAGGTIAWSTDGTPGDTVDVPVDNPNGLSVDSSLIGQTLDLYNSGQTTYKGQVLVTNVNGSTVTLKSSGDPQTATEAIDAIGDDDVLVANATAFGEGDDAPEAYHDSLDTVFNSVQRLKTAVEVTEDLRRASLRPNGSPELARLRNEKQREHKMRKEKLFLLGVRPGGIGGVAHGAGGGTDSQFVNHIDDAEGNTVTKTMGIIPALLRYGQDDPTADDQNVFNLDASTYDYSNFVLNTGKVFQYGGRGIKTAYCGWKVMSFFSTIFTANSSWNVEISGMQRSRLGFNYRMLETPHGMIRLVPMPIFRRTMWDSSMLVVEDDLVKRKVYAPEEYRTNIKTDNAPDLQKDVFQAWDGLCINLVEKHSLWNFSNIISQLQ